MSERLKEYWKFLKSLFITNGYLLRGMWKLTRLPKPAVTIFGSARLPHNSRYSEYASILAKKLAMGGYSIITGGGPGIMEAANRGAFEAATELQLECKGGECPIRQSSLGIGMTRLNREKANPYVQDFIIMEHFFARKWLLVRYATAFVVFPGGYGTVDELFELLTLIQTKRMPKHTVVLMGKDYWEPLRMLIHDRMLVQDMVYQKDVKLIDLITDDVDEVYDLIVKRHNNGYED